MKAKYWIISGIAGILLAVLAGAFWFNRAYTVIGGQIFEREITAVNLSDTNLKNPERLAQLESLQSADLRGTGLTTEQYDQLRTALPNCEIQWLVPFQGDYLDPNTTSLTVSSLTEAEMALLAYFPNLQSIDMMACTDTDVIMKVMDQYPQCRIQWMVPFQGDSIPNDVKELTVSTLSQEDLKTIGYFTELKSLDARKCKDLDAIEELHQLYPDVNIQCNVTLQGKTYTQSTTSLELVDANAEELMAQLKYLPRLETVTLTGTTPDMDAMGKLVDTYPNVDFVWDFTLCGVAVNSNVTELDLSNIKMTSVEEVENSLKFFNCLEKVIMFKCGISDEDMDALWKRHPETRFVWGVNFGGFYLRTDDTSFMPWKLGYTKNGRRGMNNEEAKGLKYMVDLVAIDIGHNDITDLSFLYHTPNVEYLMMCGINVTDITPLGSLKKLKYLEMWENPITDLSPLAGCESLEDINFYGIKADDLTPLLNLPLKNVWFSGRFYSDEEVEMVKVAFPESNVVPNPRWPTSVGWRRIPNYFAQRDALDMFYMDSAGEGKNKNW